MSKPNRKVIRLQQMRAQRASAAGIQHVDVVFEVPGDEEGTVKERICSFLTQDNWPLDVVKSVEEDEGNANLGILRKVATPPDAFDDLIKIAQLTVGELKDLIDELGEEAGTTAGEDSGSSPSSESTPEPSAPTSSATTPAAA
ncbi:hypothetical protein [Streptomyces scabiei]|uniref:hypothetical protein n=1 Tax=Streptomyces scabiei TaxID=1930 RepID=UPI0029BC3784|nr:hypothetical protein [Streptomyces scabiei]MDX3124535.1 hypothetical protein [Streptomyces scabiei]MDX3283907.1 hypothetical protein [Streptomyces scabiei]